MKPHMRVLLEGVAFSAAVACFAGAPLAAFELGSAVDEQTAYTAAVLTFVCLSAVVAVLLAARARRNEDAGERTPIAELLAASGYDVTPPAPAPAVGSAVPDFDPVTDAIPGRDGRLLHHDVWQALGSAQLQTDLDRIDDAPGFSDLEREWMRRVVLNGTPVEQVLNRANWEQIQKRRPTPNGGRR